MILLGTHACQKKRRKGSDFDPIASTTFSEKGVLFQANLRRLGSSFQPVFDV